MDDTETLPNFEFEVPVVVVGAGATGYAAALAARQAGADVLLLERDPVPRGSTSMSQGWICAAGSRFQREAGIEDGPDAFFDDMVSRTRGTVDRRVARIVADNAGKTVDWLADSCGVPIVLNLTWGGHFGHRVNRMHGVPSKRGEDLLGAMGREAEARGVDLMTDAHVDRLFADATGCVRGVRLRRPDGSEELVGCKALVLATSGFGANHDMVRQFIPGFGSAPNYRYFGHEGNQGEGIAWGMQLGAEVACMDAFQGYGALADGYGMTCNYDMVMQGGIVVNAEGRRFSHELADISGQALVVLNQPGGYGWIIFDDARRATVEDLPEFVALRDLAAVRSAPDAAGLARAIGVPAEALAETLAQVADYAAGRGTCPFGRDFSAQPALSGPLHALRVTGALYHTQGGLCVNGDAQVLRPDGSVLPNLFAGGGAAVGISGAGPSGYLPAAGLCAAVTLGRLAGAAAARLAGDPADTDRNGTLA
jgi:fumarate reductase flavoprotein subunit